MNEDFITSMYRENFDKTNKSYRFSRWAKLKAESKLDEK